MDYYNNLYNLSNIPTDWINQLQLNQSQNNLIYTPLSKQNTKKQYTSSEPELEYDVYGDYQPNYVIEPISITKPKAVIWGTDSDIERTPVATQTQTIRKRGATQFKNSNIQVGNMRELLDKFEEAGISVRVTSGIEQRYTKSGKKSRHWTGDAIDITPVEGESFENLIEQIRNSPDLLAYMRNNGIGVINETDPKIKAKTGATGDHLHFSRNEDYALHGFSELFG